jgi:hypothetical protein
LFPFTGFRCILSVHTHSSGERSSCDGCAAIEAGGGGIVRAVVDATRGTLVMVTTTTQAGGGGIVRAAIDVARGAPPMFIDSIDF